MNLIIIAMVMFFTTCFLSVCFAIPEIEKLVREIRNMLKFQHDQQLKRERGDNNGPF